MSILSFRKLWFVVVVVSVSIFPEVPKKMNYDSKWQEIEAELEKGKSKSALSLILELADQAKRENNSAQMLKALIFELKARSNMEEEELVKAMARVESLLSDKVYGKFPTKQVLHSMLAELYWRYFENNRYKFLNRTTMTDVQKSDIRTWDLNTIVDFCIQHYLLSLENSKESSKFSIENLLPILTSGESGRVYRPSLYDFLAHRALDFFINTQTGLTSPKDKFTLELEVDSKTPSKKKFIYLSPASNFFQAKIESTDTSSFLYNGIKIFQSLLKQKWEEKEKNPTEQTVGAFVEVDLKRIEYVYQNSHVPEIDKIYLNALEELFETHKQYIASSKVKYFIARFFSNRAKKYNPQQSNLYKWDYKTADEICSSVISQYKGSMGAKMCEALQAELRYKEFSFSMEKLKLPNELSFGKLTYRNIEDIYVKILEYDSKDFQLARERFDQSRKNAEYRDFLAILLDILLSKKELKSYYKKLPNPKDFHTHSVEIDIPELGLGQYVFLLSDKKDFSYNTGAVSINFFQNTELSYIQRYTEKDNEFYVLHRKTGLPLENVTVKAYAQIYVGERGYEDKLIFSSKTDSKGHVEIPFYGKEYYNYYVEFSKDKDILENSNWNPLDSYYAKHYKSLYYQNTYYRDPEESTLSKIFFFTDRAIYRPGQILYFKGLCLSIRGKQNSIVKNKEVTVTLFDVNNQKVSQQNFRTNEYGTFSGSFILPQGKLNGQFYLQAENSYHYVSVEEYKPPKFEVILNSPKEAYRLKEKVKITGIAKTYSGAFVDKAKVQYRVVRTASFPPWWSYFRFVPSSPQMEITSGELTTNEKGEFSLEFLAVPDETVPKDSKPSFHYEVNVDVTDINGETISTSQTIVVGYVALQLNVNIPSVVVKEKLEPYKLSLTNLSGQPESKEVHIDIHKLKSPTQVYRARKWELPDQHLFSKEEWIKRFPFDPYKDEDKMYNWQKEKLVFQSKINSNSKFELNSNLSSGTYVLEAKTKDKYGEEVKDIKYFTLLSVNDKTSPYLSFDQFFEIQTKGEPEQEAQFLINTNTKNTVLYEVEYDGKILHSEWIDFTKQKDSEMSLFKEKIKEEYRGNFGIHLSFIRENRAYTHSQLIQVPYTNKELEISYESFRNKLLPGQEEEWKLKIKGKQVDKVTAELVATLYDASLDALRKNFFTVDIYRSLWIKRNWNVYKSFELNQASLYFQQWNTYIPLPSIEYDSLNWFGYTFSYNYPLPRRAYKMRGKFKPRDEDFLAESVDEADSPPSAPVVEETNKKEINPESISQAKLETKSDTPQIRSNFAQTAFFYPHLETDAEGSVSIKFKIPDSLTKWKFLAFAHSPDLKLGFSQREIITQKDLMVVPNFPRFFREDDVIYFATKLNNLTDTKLQTEVRLQIFDAVDMKELEKHSPISVEVNPQESSLAEWKLKIPRGVSALTYRILAKSGNFSDGEEMTLPVLTNQMLVTESLPLSIRSSEKKVFELKKLIESTEKSTLRHYSLTLEFTPRPIWYAIQALPYLMEYPYECIEQTFNRYYANSLSFHIVNSDPKIKRVFEAWKKIPDSQKGALSSNLEKNPELKSLLLEETPWVMEAQEESERKKRIALLFDVNGMSLELQRALHKIQEQQLVDGAWSWFKGLTPDRFMTQYIVAGMGQLDRLQIKTIRQDSKTWNMVTKAIGYLDKKIQEDFDDLKRQEKKKLINLEEDHLYYLAIHYLYARSFFVDLSIPKSSQEAFNYFFKQAKKYWLYKNRYAQGMIALALHRFGEKKVPKEILISLKENAIYSEEMGMYWNTSYGYYWYEFPIETHSLLIEVFEEVGKDSQAVDALKVWLLKQKQTTNWKTTKATANAIYALLLRGENLLSVEKSEIQISLGKTTLDLSKTQGLNQEEGSGYFKKTFSSNEIFPEMGKVTIEKKDKGISWGALYWQYFENLDKITPHQTPLQLKKQLFLQKNTNKGPILIPISSQKLKVGDLIKVRIELRVDRNMEYVHMKDMRASGLEPINVFSTHKYQDGLYYYESTKDASTNFFFSYLPKGTYVFEYPLRVSQKGNFSNGITTIQCMYAPEFTSHSEGIRIEVE